jgi:hypothetical protein
LIQHADSQAAAIIESAEMRERCKITLPSGEIQEFSGKTRRELAESLKKRKFILKNTPAADASRTPNNTDPHRFCLRLRDGSRPYHEAFYALPSHGLISKVQRTQLCRHVHGPSPKTGLRDAQLKIKTTDWRVLLHRVGLINAS